MTNPERETASKAEYLKARIHDATALGGAGVAIFAAIIAAQIIVAAFGVVLDHYCRYGGGKEHCISAVRTASALAASPAARQSRP